ncbi:MAG: ABC transporter permease [Armatimonadota bacterium]|nr:ABC transporter permease [Armatimonadota bacterium]MDR7427614.1 ABC transporter permease [Armatimonadota bacterium]MDR7469582.1 ABC transporter permease [Armatimonadota bacterium]MDR7475835.1 ABC transporter permease [Armatimonadota bacterium]
MRRQSAVRYLLRRRLAVVGLVVLLGIGAAAALAPWISPYDPGTQVWEMALQPPSVSHWLGTDEFGRDVLSRILFGGRISLAVGFLAVGMAAGIGVPAGLVSGYAGGRVDVIVMRIMDVLLAFPAILLALAIVGALGPGVRNAILAVGIVVIPAFARVVRGATLVVRTQDYVEAARAVGAGAGRIVARHVFPNAMAPVIVQATLGVGTAILSSAGLSFLGLGAQPPTPDWGGMLASGREFMLQAWWITTFPGMAIMLTVLGFNLVGDALRDMLDPRLRLPGA